MMRSPRRPIALLLLLVALLRASPSAAQPVSPPTAETPEPARPDSERPWAEELRRSCAAGDPQSCDLVGYARVEDAGGVVGDEAWRLFQGACAGGYGMSCWRVGEVQRGQGELTLAFGTFARGCKAGAELACTAAARALTAGEGVPPSSTAAHIYYQRGCELGSATACLAVGRVAEACALEDWEACMQGGFASPADAAEAP